ncbi:hypothetical protein ABBQ38_015431 [Trebouxia sp. C0009 RCD-2024]
MLAETQNLMLTCRSASGLLKSYPGLEPTNLVHNLLKKSLSRSLSSWLQSTPSTHGAAHSKLLQSRQQSAELMSKGMSAELYPGLERAISTWAQQAQHDRADMQPSSAPVSRAASDLYPGLQRAISSWAQQAQHGRAAVQLLSTPASRTASGLYPGLEQAMSNCAQQAQHDRSHCQPLSYPASRAASGLYPGLEQAISNWAQQALPLSQSIPHAMSGMSDVPGLEQAISSWAQQAQRDSSSEQSSPETKQGPSQITAMPGLADAPLPLVEGQSPPSSWAQQGQEDVDYASLSASSVARAMSGMSDVPPGLEPRMPCPSQTELDSMHLEEPLTKAMSSLSECLYPGLEHAVPICAQQAQDDSPDEALSHPSLPRSMSIGSEAWCPELERAISNWAQQAQHGIIRSLQGASPAQSIAPGGAECLYPGLEQTMTDWAQQAHCDIINKLQSHASDCLYCPGLEPPPEALPSHEQQPVDTQSTASDSDAALAQAIGEAVLAAARLDNPAAAAKVAAEAVTETLFHRG